MCAASWYGFLIQLACTSAGSIMPQRGRGNTQGRPVTRRVRRHRSPGTGGGTGRGRGRGRGRCVRQQRQPGPRPKPEQPEPEVLEHASQQSLRQDTNLTDGESPGSSLSSDSDFSSNSDSSSNSGSADAKPPDGPEPGEDGDDGNGGRPEPGSPGSVAGNNANEGFVTDDDDTNGAGCVIHIGVPRAAPARKIHGKKRKAAAAAAAAAAEANAENGP